MNRNHRFSQQSSEDIFAEAVERLEAGESVNKIIASYSGIDRDELRDFLSIVKVSKQIHKAPLPRPSAARRLTAKQDFLNAAADLRHASQPKVTTATVPAASKRRTRRAKPVKTGLLDRVAAAVQSVFTVRTLRLAPMIVLLALVLLSTTTVVTMAQTAVPGDLAYSLKQWIRKQELELAPPDRRAYVRQEQERELAEDVRKAAAKADNNSAIIQVEDTQIFYGRTGRLLKIGPLTVVDRYQPDANLEDFKQMAIDGELVPGAEVDLIYQILPGQSDTVQGVSLTVIAPPTETAIVEPGVDTAVTPENQSEAGTCTVEQPEGWVYYQVQVGDNLTFIANRGGTSVEELMAVNCLDSDTIWIGATIYVPEQTVELEGRSGACATDIPSDWVAYEVQVGDNLSRLAQDAGTTIDEIKSVNCLDSDTILIGASLFVPAGN